MTNYWLAFIEGNTSGTGRLFVREAAQQGFHPVFLTADPSRYNYLEEEKTHILRVNTQDVQALFTTCDWLQSNHGLAGVISSSEYFIAPAAVIAHRLGLPGPQPEAIQACRDKHEQRLRLQAAGIGVPAFRAADSIDEVIAVTESLKYPVVVKPISGSGSIGVKLCASADDLFTHAEALFSQKSNERGLPVLHRILIEEMLVGPEYSIEAFSGSIIGVTQKYLGSLPYFVEVGHDFPAVLTPAVEKAIHQIVQRTLEVLNLRWGPAHVELRLTGEGPKIIEVNPRLAGGFIPELVRLAYGIDLIAETIRLVTGRELCLHRTSDQYASVRFLMLDQDQEGTLITVNGLDVAKQVPDIAAIDIYARIGSCLQHFGDFRDRIGHVIASASTCLAARIAAERAQQVIQICIQSCDKEC